VGVPTINPATFELSSKEVLRGVGWRYGAAFAAVGISFLLRQALTPWLFDDRGFIVFLPAIVIVAFIAGLRPALLTAALSGILVWYFFIPPFHTFRLDVSGAVGLATFILAVGVCLTLVQMLRESEQRWQYLASIVETSDDAIVSKTVEGIIQSWNQAAERIFGYSAAEAIGQPITIIIPQERQDEEREILARIRRGERIEHFETVRQRKNGELIDISLTVSPVKDAHGKVVGASKTARDITDRKQDQKKIAVLAREAEHRSKNLLASVQATVHLSQSDTPEGLKQAIEARIQALAKINSLFVQTRWVGAELSTIAMQEFAPYLENDNSRVRMVGPRVLLEPDAAQAMAMLLHELVTNGAKYGALCSVTGKVDLEWSRGSDGQVELRWTESGGPPIGTPTRQGFGSRMIEAMVGELKGKANMDWRSDGLVCEIAFQAGDVAPDGRARGSSSAGGDSRSGQRS
jgi:PAS domain S-box-containing protein